MRVHSWLVGENPSRSSYGWTLLNLLARTAPLRTGQSEYPQPQIPGLAIHTHTARQPNSRPPDPLLFLLLLLSSSLWTTDSTIYKYTPLYYRRSIYRRKREERVFFSPTPDSLLLGGFETVAVQYLQSYLHSLTHFPYHSVSPARLFTTRNQIPFQCIRTTIAITIASSRICPVISPSNNWLSFLRPSTPVTITTYTFRQTYCFNTQQAHFQSLIYLASSHNSSSSFLHFFYTTFLLLKPSIMQ